MTCLSSRLKAIAVIGFECECSALDTATRWRVGEPVCSITSHNLTAPAVPPVTIQRPSWDLGGKNWHTFTYCCSYYSIVRTITTWQLYIVVTYDHSGFIHGNGVSFVILVINISAEDRIILVQVPDHYFLLLTDGDRVLLIAEQHETIQSTHSLHVAMHATLRCIIITMLIIKIILFSS